ncbi:MAG: biotin--[acetyl-CoA-carboxylase] ligase [Anaerolineales bacterium]|nr:biotin--[acetyl-CoA-carboxylase] ligase [Anaerolineales bacterium]
MNQTTLETTLADLPLGGIRYFDSIGSTNDAAARWANEGAADCSLVVADEQTAGRGRGSRRWFTPPGAALAFSLILRPDYPELRDQLARLNGLGALAVCQTLQKTYQLSAQIKWPNDVLLNRRKVAGVLPESKWLGDQLSAVVLGIGVNIAAAAIPPVDWAGHHAHSFPAASVETMLGAAPERDVFLCALLQNLLDWYPRLMSAEFLHAWDANLAFRGEWVQIITSEAEALDARLFHLNPDASLRVQVRSGGQANLRAGEIHLRPVDSSLK